MELHKWSPNICSDSSRVEWKEKETIFCCPYSTTPLLKLTQGFSASALLTFRARPPFTLRAVPCIFKHDSSIPGFYPLDAHSTSSCENQRCLKTLPMSPVGKISPVENWINAYTLCYFLKLKLTALPKPPGSSDHLFPGDLTFITIIHLITIP